MAKYGQYILMLLVVACVVAIPLYSFSEGSGDDKIRIWNYGHGENAHLRASDEEIDAFYKKVIAIPPNKRGRLQKYRKSLMRWQEGYEYEPDSVWNKKYKQLIRAETKAWKKRHKK